MIELRNFKENHESPKDSNPLQSKKSHQRLDKVSRPSTRAPDYIQEFQKHYPGKEFDLRTHWKAPAKGWDSDPTARKEYHEALLDIKRMMTQRLGTAESWFGFEGDIYSIKTFA